MKNSKCEECNSKDAFKTLCLCSEVGYGRHVELSLCASCQNKNKERSLKLLKEV